MKDRILEILGLLIISLAFPPAMLAYLYDALQEYKRNRGTDK